MPGPFPGMDPWLESDEVFPDLHASLIAYLRESLNGNLPPGYVAITNTLVWREDRQRRVPDVNIHGGERRSEQVQRSPLTGLIELGEDHATETVEAPYLEIRSGRGKRLVTAMEVLSRSNKPGGSPGRKVYRKKLWEFQDAGVNVVEIDLLRAGAHTTAVPLGRLQAAGAFDYHVSVWLGGRSPRFLAAPIRLEDRLPAIGIPLDAGVPEVVIDLQPLLDRAYDTGRYGEFVDYSQEAEPPLTREQQAWAEGILRAKGLLPASAGEST